MMSLMKSLEVSEALFQMKPAGILQVFYPI